MRRKREREGERGGAKKQPDNRRLVPQECKLSLSKIVNAARAVHARTREKSARGEDERTDVATLSATNVTDNARFITKFGDGGTADYYSPRVVIFH